MTEIEKIQLRQTTLGSTIACGAGNEYNDCNMLLTNPDKIVEAAKKFETYLKEITND